MVIGYDDVESADKELLLENLAFAFSDRYGSNKALYYREHLLKERSDDVEPEEVMMPVESPPTAVSSTGPMNSPWPMQCHDNYHTGRSTYSTAGNSGIEKWRFECDWVEDTPVIDSDGTIYVGGGHGGLPWYLIAVYPNGTLKWRYKTGGLILGSSPAIAEDGTVYVGSWDDYLYAINPDGTRKWRFLAHDDIASSPAIADDGTIYFGTMLSGGRIYAVNPNGTEKWYYTTDHAVTSDPAIGDDGTIYIGSLDSYFYAMNPNGTLKWRFKTGDRIYGSPSIADDGTIYIGSSWDSYLYALYPNGTLKWKYKNAGTPSNPSIGNDGTIYAGYVDKLVALNPNGTLKWSFNLGTDRWIGKSSPAISADGTIYVGTNIGDAAGGDLIAVNTNGTEKWRKKIAYEWVDSSPSIAEDGSVYIGSAYDIAGGYLHAFGSVESNAPPETPVMSGTINGKAREEYYYTFTSIDPDNNPVLYYVDWGDDTTTETMDFASGEQGSASHTYNARGEYTIKAKARDTLGEESDWATLEVSMPKNKIINPFERFLKNHPYMFPILRKIFD